MNFFKAKSQFIFSSNSLSALPKASHIPEIAFAGRSNVGKSSLINSITYRKNLARRSKTPGCTKSLNFFDVGGKLIIVDFPGYGYNKQNIDLWSGVIEHYLTSNRNFLLLLLLIDSRRSISEGDINVIDWLENNNIKYSIILTKCDKVNSEVIKLTSEEILLNASPEDIFAISARKNLGIESLRSYVYNLSK